MLKKCDYIFSNKNYSCSKTKEASCSVVFSVGDMQGKFLTILQAKRGFNKTKTLLNHRTKFGVLNKFIKIKLSIIRVER